MKEQRYFYVGPREHCPPYQKTQDTRYATTGVQGLKVVWAIHRAEFPDAYPEWRGETR